MDDPLLRDFAPGELVQLTFYGGYVEVCHDEEGDHIAVGCFGGGYHNVKVGTHAIFIETFDSPLQGHQSYKILIDGSYYYVTEGHLRRAQSET